MTKSKQQFFQLSIVVPVLNEAEQLPDFLEHLACFKKQQCQIVFVDGGSSDASTHLIEAAGFSVLQTSKGRALQMNAGAKLAKGIVLLFLHADSRLPENTVELIQKAVDSGAVWGRFNLRLQVNKQGNKLLLKVVEVFINWRSRYTGIATGDQAIFVMRNTFEHVGGFSLQPLMEDVELSKQLKKIGAPACFKQKVATSARRWEERGVLKTILLMWRLRFAYWRGVPPEVLTKHYPDGFL